MHSDGVARTEFRNILFELLLFEHFDYVQNKISLPDVHADNKKPTAERLLDASKFST